MDLQKTFPTGQYSDNQQQYMVKEGQYFWAAAVCLGGVWEMTDFGRRVAVVAPGVIKRRKDAPVVAPETVAPDDDLDL